MKTVIKLIISITVAFSFFVPKITATWESVQKQWLSYLVVGLDDAAENTDSMMVVSINPSGNSASLLQIPRDTLVSLSGRERKINSLYSYYRSSGNSNEQAMRMLADFLTDSLGISLDAYIALRPTALEKFVDEIGGVYVNLPEDLVKEGRLDGFAVGENLLCGKDALALVRYRRGYLSADLGRIDAQKLFVSGVYHTVTERVDFKTTLRAFSKINDSLVTSFGFDDIIAISFKGCFDFSSFKFNYATLPGRAVLSDGISYYVLSRKSASSLISELSLSSGEFDSTHTFVSDASAVFTEVYFKTDIPYKIYSDNELAEINVP